jgi:hypothetical protein
MNENYFIINNAWLFEFPNAVNQAKTVTLNLEHAVHQITHGPLSPIIQSAATFFQIASHLDRA